MVILRKFQFKLCVKCAWQNKYYWFPTGAWGAKFIPMQRACPSPVQHLDPTLALLWGVLWDGALENLAQNAAWNWIWVCLKFGTVLMQIIQLDCISRNIYHAWSPNRHQYRHYFQPCRFSQADNGYTSVPEQGRLWKMRTGSKYFCVRWLSLLFSPVVTDISILIGFTFHCEWPISIQKYFL